MNVVKIKYLIVLALFVFTTNAQDTKITDDLKKINNSLKNYSSIQMDVTYLYYVSYSSKTPLETQKGILKKKGDMQYWDFMGIETIINDKYLLIVDSAERKIVIGPKGKNAAHKSVDDIELSKLLKYYDKPVSIVNGKYSGYKFTCKAGIHAEHKSIEIYFNPKTFVVEKIVFYYANEMAVDPDNEEGSRDKPRLEIVFSNVNLNANLSNSVFSESKYVVVNGKEVTPQNPYQKFSIIKNNTSL